MEITYRQFRDLKMNPGWVMVKFFRNTSIVLANGEEIVVPDHHVQNEGRYVPFHGEVVKICESPDPHAEIVDAVIQPKVGDYLFFDYKCGLDALLYTARGDKDMLMHVVDKNIVYMVLPYEMCYAYMKSEEIREHERNRAKDLHSEQKENRFKYLHPINGVYLVTTVPHIVHKGLVVSKQYPMDPWRFKVERIPTTPVKYRDKSKFDPFQTTDIKPGDIVTVTAHAGNFLEFEIFKNKYSVPTCMQVHGSRILCIEA
jgi:hypothetical protein